MRHRLSGLSMYGLNGLDREMSTPPKPHWGTASTVPLPTESNVHCVRQCQHCSSATFLLISSFSDALRSCKLLTHWQLNVPYSSPADSKVMILLCVLQLEQRRKLSEYKLLKEREEEERQAEEMERLKTEAEEKRIVAAELTARYRDRVSHAHTSVICDISNDNCC